MSSSLEPDPGETVLKNLGKGTAERLDETLQDCSERYKEIFIPKSKPEFSA
jgi:hypothetical protein